MKDVVFGNWAGLGRTALLGVLAYVSGKRTLSKIHAFDFVVTIALGSTLAFARLIGCPFVITWLSVRSNRVRRLVKAEPGRLVHRGEILPAHVAKSV